MPAGVIATIDGAFATLEFTTKAAKDAGLAKLLEIGGPGSIQTITRRGPRRKYRVPTDNANEAELIDGDEPETQWSAGNDSGTAAALKAADPNVNAGGGEDWHTPYDQHSSVNAYVSTVHETGSSGIPTTHKPGSGFGGTGADETPTSATLIESLTALKAPEATTPPTTPPAWPATGQPNDSWTRAQLDAFAAAFTPTLDTTGLANKAAVVTAIGAPREAWTLAQLQQYAAAMTPPRDASGAADKTAALAIINAA